MDPRTHQRDVGEKERYPAQQDQGNQQSEAHEARARAKMAKNNKDSHDQTGRAIADAKARGKK